MLQHVCFMPSWEHTILVQKQSHIRPVPLHCHKTFPLTPPIGHDGFGAPKATQELGAGGYVHLRSQRSPGRHRGLSGGWCYSLFASRHLGSGALVCLPGHLHLPCHGPKGRTGTRPMTYIACSKSSLQCLSEIPLWYRYYNGKKNTAMCSFCHL